MIEAEFSEELAVLLQIADAMARRRVVANTDTPLDAERALMFGTMGIGLCRTEQMFDGSLRLPMMIEMVVVRLRKSARVLSINCSRSSAKTSSGSLR
ncbi:MAG: putative PEP-binding protein [Methanomicrobiales archaeon]